MENVLINLELRTSEYNKLPDNLKEFFEPIYTDHFATFPQALLEIPIKFGCPEKICKKCGKIREKIIESKGYHFPEKDKIDKQHIAGVGISTYKSGPDFKKFKEENPDIFRGYSDCGCNAGFEAGIVLDPFMGAGTTAMVAKKLGRNYLGIELNEKYIKIADARLKAIPETLF